MKKLLLILLSILFANTGVFAQYVYPFQNTSLSDEKRLDNLLSIMTIDEKINALSTNLGVPRLGIRNTGHSEGLHGMALGGPGKVAEWDAASKGKRLPEKASSPKRPKWRKKL